MIGLHRRPLTGAPPAGGLPPPRLLLDAARFVAARREDDSRVSLWDVEQAGATLGVIVGVERAGRLEALPDRLYGFVPAPVGPALDLDALWLALRRTFGGRFSVVLPPPALAAAQYEADKLGRYRSHRTFLLEAGSVEEAWRRLARVGRQGVRKAQREGVRVEWRDDDLAWARYLQLHVAKAVRRRAPAWSRHDTVLLREVFGDSLRLVLGVHAGRVVSGVVLVVYDDYALFVDNASDPAAWALNPNNLVVWSAVERVVRDGVRLVDYGFSAKGEAGTARFKEHMGGVEVAVYAVTAG